MILSLPDEMFLFGFGGFKTLNFYGMINPDV